MIYDVLPSQFPLHCLGLFVLLLKSGRSRDCQMEVWLPSHRHARLLASLLSCWVDGCKQCFCPTCNVFSRAGVKLGACSESGEDVPDVNMRLQTLVLVRCHVGLRLRRLWFKSSLIHEAHWMNLGSLTLNLTYFTGLSRG